MAKEFISENIRLISEWHPTKNTALQPEKITCGSNKKVWWRCKREHEWEAIINNRSNGGNCPYCSGQRVCDDNSLQTLNPQLAEQWHSIKNEDLTPNNVTLGSGKKVWWLCEKGHEWEAHINNRSKGHDCPYCSGRCASPINNLQILNPELSKQWHPSKNEGLTPDNVKPYSNKKVWWICEKKHEWEAIVCDRSYGNGCPTCNRGKQTSFQEQAIYFYIKSVFSDTLNRYKYDGKEIDVFVPSLKFGIEYRGIFWHKDKVIINRKKDNYIQAKGISLLLIEETDVKTTKCYRKGNVIYCNERLSDIQRNEIILMCFDYISEKLTLEPYIIDIDVKRDKRKIYDLYIEGEEDESFFIKFPELSRQWHPTKNLSVKPNMVRAKSGQIAWWKCEKGHEWEAGIADRANGKGCPYCAGQRACADNCLQTLEPELSKQWHFTKNGDITPIDVTTGSGKNVWWRCEKGHEWVARIAHRANGVGCPYCSGRYASSENNLQILNPELAKQWHPTKNGELTPSDVTASSHKKAWWQCEKEHQWEATVKKRSRGSGCPYCNNNKA